MHGLRTTQATAIITMLLAAMAFTAAAQAAPRKHPPVTRVTVLVTDKTTHKPIFQARLTLSFRDPDSHIGSSLSFSAKTDMQGKYVFSFIPMEPVMLVVTAPDHQTFGQQFNITHAGQTLHVQLNPPQPLR